MPPELAQWIPPAVIIGVMLYLHRMTRQDMSRMEGRLREDMKQMESRLESRMDGLEKGVGDLRDRLRRIEERMARLEGTLDVLREFFLRPIRSQTGPPQGSPKESSGFQEERRTSRQPHRKLM